MMLNDHALKNSGNRDVGIWKQVTTVDFRNFRSAKNSDRISDFHPHYRYHCHLFSPEQLPNRTVRKQQEDRPQVVTQTQVLDRPVLLDLAEATWLQSTFPTRNPSAGAERR